MRCVVVGLGPNGRSELGLVVSGEYLKLNERTNDLAVTTSRAGRTVLGQFISTARCHREDLGNTTMGHISAIYQQWK